MFFLDYQVYEPSEKFLNWINKFNELDTPITLLTNLASKVETNVSAIESIPINIVTINNDILTNSSNITQYELDIITLKANLVTLKNNTYDIRDQYNEIRKTNFNYSDRITNLITIDQEINDDVISLQSSYNNLNAREILLNSNSSNNTVALDANLITQASNELLLSNIDTIYNADKIVEETAKENIYNAQSYQALAQYNLDDLNTFITLINTELADITINLNDVLNLNNDINVKISDVNTKIVTQTSDIVTLTTKFNNYVTQINTTKLSLDSYLSQYITLLEKSKQNKNNAQLFSDDLDKKILEKSNIISKITDIYNDQLLNQTAISTDLIYINNQITQFNNLFISVNDLVNTYYPKYKLHYNEFLSTDINIYNTNNDITTNLTNIKSLNTTQSTDLTTLNNNLDNYSSRVYLSLDSITNINGKYCTINVTVFEFINYDTLYIDVLLKSNNSSWYNNKTVKFVLDEDQEIKTVTKSIVLSGLEISSKYDIQLVARNSNNIVANSDLKSFTTTGNLADIYLESSFIYFG